MRSAIDGVRAGFRLEAQGAAHNMAKTHLAYAGGQLHAIGAALPSEGLVGAKTWAHTSAGATPLVVLWDAANGALLAVVEAFALGQLRTGAVSGLATDLLAPAGADSLALCGTGKQAFAQAEAVACVRRLARVRVYGRDAARREALARAIEERLGVPTTPCASVEEAVKDAAIVTLVTRATRAFLGRDLPRPGAHLNAIGSITPERREFEPSLLARCGVVAVDSVAQARELSAELREHYGADDAAWRAVRPLAELAARGAARPADGSLTLFKSLGVGIADLALARVVHSNARARGLGRALPQPERRQGPAPRPSA